MTDQTQWLCVEQLDMTGMELEPAKDLLGKLVDGYEAQGKRVKVVAKSIVEIYVNSDD